MDHRVIHRALAAVFVIAALALPGAASAADSAANALACGSGTGAGLLGGFGTHNATARTFDRDKNTRSITPDSTIPSGQTPATSASFSATVPVVFHVIAASKSPRDGWVSDDQIARQIDVLNKGFAGAYGGTDTGFRFQLVKITRTINAKWFAMATFADEVEAKQALREGDATTLNIYSNSGAGFLGFAYYPKIVAGSQDYLDGVVIHFDSMPGGHIKNYNLGYTATHETGHWVGLAHTFEGGCIGKGDEVADTPAEATPTSGCPVGKDTCPAPGDDPIHNYMDYSYDSCYTEFTPGQGTRAQEQYLFWRVKHGY
jgi:hypothetical protein